MTKQEYRGSPHTAWAKDGKVFLANEEDSYYTEEFRSREELEVFIQHDAPLFRPHQGLQS